MTRKAKINSIDKKIKVLNQEKEDILNEFKIKFKCGDNKDLIFKLDEDEDLEVYIYDRDTCYNFSSVYLNKKEIKLLKMFLERI